jgi:hypothetical protein
LNPYGIVSNPGGGLVADYMSFGYPSGTGAIDPTTLNGYTLLEADEGVFYASTNGTFDPVISRTVRFSMTGGSIPLVQADITSIATPTDGVLTSVAASSFTPTSSGGSWQWSLPLGSGVFPAYMGAGTLTVTV